MKTGYNDPSLSIATPTVTQDPAYILVASLSVLRSDHIHFVIQKRVCWWSQSQPWPPQGHTAVQQVRLPLTALVIGLSVAHLVSQSLSLKHQLPPRALISTLSQSIQRLTLSAGQQRWSLWTSTQPQHVVNKPNTSMHALHHTCFTPQPLASHLPHADTVTWTRTRPCQVRVDKSLSPLQRSGSESGLIHDPTARNGNNNTTGTARSDHVSLPQMHSVTLTWSLIMALNDTCQ